MIKCNKCGRSFKYQHHLNMHIGTCDGNPIPKKKRRKYGNHKDHGKALKGKSFDEQFRKEKSEKIKNKISQSSKSFNSWDRLSEKEKNQMRKKLSKIAKKRYDEGWDPKAGRCKKYKYKNFTVDGTWELEFCKWGDEFGLTYERNLDRFEYEFEGELHKYKPDFKLDEGLYVEVKGYQTELDGAKWSQFSHDLIVLKRSQIDRIKKRTFKLEDLNKYKL